MMTTAPATHSRYFLYSRIIWPMLVAAAPSITNTRVKPRMNMSECNSTVFNSLRSLVCSSSTLAQEISETYPGTSGNTHGDRNETIPARNAVIGKGNEDIGLSKRQMKDVLYCNLVTLFLTDGKFANLTADNADLHGSEKETPTTEARRRGENSTINGFVKLRMGSLSPLGRVESVARKEQK